MTDWINKILTGIGITGSSAKALQFVVGVGLVAFSLVKYSNENQILPIIGILFSGYLILKAIQ